MSKPLFIEKLHLRNFRSIRSETLSFDNPLFLVGRNGTGKSNLVEAFTFLADCMRLPLRSVVEERGDLLRIGNARTPSHAPYVGLRVDFHLPTENRKPGHYMLLLEVAPDRNLIVSREQCVVITSEEQRVWFSRQAGKFDTNVPGLNLNLDALALALPLIGGTQEFAPVFSAFELTRTSSVIHQDRKSVACWSVMAPM